MTKGITEIEPDPELVYAEYIHLPHHVSSTRPQMSLNERAAQFSPFDALAGYEESICEEARPVEDRRELGEQDMELLDSQLWLIQKTIDGGAYPTVTITRFVPDGKKAGGAYVTSEEEIYRVDAIEQKLILTRTTGFGKQHATIAFDKIVEIHGEDVDFSDEI